MSSRDNAWNSIYDTAVIRCEPGDIGQASRLVTVADELMERYAAELSPLGPGLDLSKYQGVPRGSMYISSDATKWKPVFDNEFAYEIEVLR